MWFKPPYRPVDVALALDVVSTGFGLLNASEGLVGVVALVVVCWFQS